MAKLFAFEDETSSSNDLLIDKVLERSKQPKSPLSLTADVLKQRQELNKDIEKKLDDPQANDAEEKKDDKPAESEDSPAADDSGQEDKPADDQPKQDDKPSQSDENTEDETAAADSEDGLNDLMGSGLGGGESTKEEKKEEPAKADAPATESFKSHKVTLANVFTPLRNRYNGYKASLQAYALESQATPIQAQPVVYVKDSVIESLNNLVELSNNYIRNNTAFIENISKSVKDLNERIAVFKQFVEKKSYHFTNKLVNDRDILGNISIPEKSDLRATLKVLATYVEKSTQATALAVSNEFESLESGYLNSGFSKETEDLVYRQTLPGFNMVRLHLPAYKNYISTPIQDFQYYRLKVLKTEDLYSLPAISITEDNDLEFVTESIDKLLIAATVGVDNLSDISSHFTALIDQLKVLIFDVEKDKHKDLASLDIDSKVKDFIRFKLSIEAYYININLILEIMTSVMSVLNQVVELKD